MRAMALISRRKPESQVPPTAVQFGWSGQGMTLVFDGSHHAGMVFGVDVKGRDVDPVAERAACRCENRTQRVESQPGLRGDIRFRAAILATTHLS
jgi:hypothetical protein